MRARGGNEYIWRTDDEDGMRLRAEELLLLLAPDNTAAREIILDAASLFRY